MNNTLIMSPRTVSLLVVDVQEKLMPLIPEADRLVANISFLLDAAEVVKIPVLATEQYPKGLGGTVSELAARLPERPDKQTFSCCGATGVLEELQREGRYQVLLVGIEAHVCVQQTALDLLSRGLQVFIAADTIGSRYEVDKAMALRRMEQAGVTLTTCEAAAFEWVERAGTPEFKILSKLVQERMRRLDPPRGETPLV